MSTEQTLEQRIKLVERKAPKVGIVVALAAALFIHPLAAPLAFVLGTVFSNIFFMAMAGLLFAQPHDTRQDNEEEARHKTDLINMPVTSTLSVYRNAGSGYQHYHDHLKFRL